jgi:hypothetical protein
MMTQREALEVLAAHRGGRVVVTTMTAAGLWPQLSDTPLDFAYIPSSMGQGVSLGLGLALATLGYLVAYRDRIPPGVHALGVDLGGLRQHEAQARLAAHLDAVVHARPALRVDGAEVALPATAFGDPGSLAARLSLAAAQVGRETPLSPVAVALRAASSEGIAVQVPVVDSRALREALAVLAAEVDRPTVEAQLLVDRADPARETLRTQPGQAGRRLDVERTAEDLAAAFPAGGSSGSSGSGGGGGYSDEPPF